MKKLEISIIFFLLLNLSLSFAQNLNQSKIKIDLNTEIRKMDSLLFDLAFNKCNLDLFKTIVSEDIEFYDDRTGLNTSFDKEVRSFKDKCSKPFSVTRKLIYSDTSILGDYGAVQVGEHEFFVADKKVQKAKFITIWERKNNSWVVKRTVSYEHKNIENED